MPPSSTPSANPARPDLGLLALRGSAGLLSSLWDCGCGHGLNRPFAQPPNLILLVRPWTTQNSKCGRSARSRGLPRALLACEQDGLDAVVHPRRECCRCSLLSPAL